MILILTKIAVSICFVLILSIIAENCSPAIAGFFSAFPTGTAITLFFIGVEQGSYVSGEAAVYNITGIFAMLSFLLGYYLINIGNNYTKTFFSTISGVIFYTTAVFVIQLIKFNRISAVLFAVFSVLIFYFLFKKIDNTTITSRVKLTFPIIVLRSVLAATIILSVTYAANFVSPKLSGLLTAFPTTLYPLIIITDITYKRANVNAIIKNVPSGFVSLILFSLVVSFAFPHFGVYAGIVISYLAAISYSTIYFFVRNRYCKTL